MPARGRGATPPAVPAHIIARLYLKAVLPVLPLYVEREESARTAIEGWRFAVRFTSVSGVTTTLCVRNAAVAIDQPGPGFALRLLFLRDRDLVRAFRGEGLPRVLPWGGLHHLARFRAFSTLLADMAQVLNTPLTGTPERGPGGKTAPPPRHPGVLATSVGEVLPPGDTSGRAATSPHPRASGGEGVTSASGGSRISARRELRVALLFGALLPAAVAELGTHDDECRRLLLPFGDFAAWLSVPPVAQGWILRCGGRMTWGRGDPPVAPDVRIEFRDPEVALSAADGRLDSLAASVTGEVSVRGMIPLADALSRVMERVSALLDDTR